LKFHHIFGLLKRHIPCFKKRRQSIKSNMVVEEIAKAGGSAVANFDSFDSVAGGGNI